MSFRNNQQKEHQNVKNLPRLETYVKKLSNDDAALYDSFTHTSVTTKLTETNPLIDTKKEEIVFQNTLNIANPFCTAPTTAEHSIEHPILSESSNVRLEEPPLQKRAIDWNRSVYIRCSGKIFRVKPRKETIWLSALRFLQRLIRQQRIPSSPLNPFFEVSDQTQICDLAVKEDEKEEEECRKMAEEIEQIVRRTPALQRTTPPNRATLIAKAATAIKQTFQTSDIKVEEKAELKGGSVYLYAMVTPNRKVRELLQTDVAISPVRRSRRILEQTGEKKRLFADLSEIEGDLAEYGYLPNKAINASVFAHNSKLGTPTKKKQKE